MLALRRAVRLSRVALQFALGAALAVLVYPVLGRDARMATRAWWCRGMLRALGVRLRVSGVVPGDCHLIAANHVSWLDAFAIGATFPCWFVAKTEVRAWPLIGWLSAANETLFLKRRSARAAYRMNAEIRARLAAGQSVAVFPEGTTTDGSRVLPFYPALFQPAADRGRRVLPLAVCYRDEAAHRATAVAYINDDPLWKSLGAVIDAPHTEAHLVLDPPLETAGRTRRELAVCAWSAVAQLRLRAPGFRASYEVSPNQAMRPVRSWRARSSPEGSHAR